jgi:hypothetical protein
MIAFLLFMGGIAGIVGIGWAFHVWKLRQHEGLTRAEFIAHFETVGAMPLISGLVYDHFQKLGTWRSFMPNPSDTLKGTYKIVDEDVEENLKEILQALGCGMPHSGILSEWFTPVETLDEVVRFLSWVITKQDPSVAVR